MILAIFIISFLSWISGVIQISQTSKGYIFTPGAIAILSSWYLLTPLGITLCCVISLITLIVVVALKT